jgi:hypothetical protein
VKLRGVPAWAWIVALVPLSIVGLGVASSLSVYGLRKHLARASAEASAAAAPSASVAPRAPTLRGESADLSSVMGRARKLANQWQPEAALLGIEAVLARGMVQTHEGASAKLTFGPSPFTAARPPSDVFVVVYDKAGLRGAPTPGRPSKVLPEPMCAPEHVLSQLANRGEKPHVLRYAFDSDERALWHVTPSDDPQQLRVFDAQDCRVCGNVVVVPRTRR